MIFEKLKTIYGFLDLLPGQHPIWQPAPPSTSLLADFPPALFPFYPLRISFLLPSHFLSTSSVFPCYFFCISFLPYFFSISTSLLTRFPAKHFFPSANPQNNNQLSRAISLRQPASSLTTDLLVELQECSGETFNLATLGKLMKEMALLIDHVH